MELKKANPIANNFLAAAIFTGFNVSVLTWVKTAQLLPLHFAYPINFVCVCVLAITLIQFAFNTVRLMQVKHKNDMKAAEIEAARLDREMEKVQVSRSQREEAVLAHTASDTASRNPQLQRIEAVPINNQDTHLPQNQPLGLQRNQDNEQ